MITTIHAYVLLAGFALLMWLITRFSALRSTTSEGFLLANRRVSLWGGTLSIAVSWIWAPAIFLSIQKAYEEGLAGVFWFVVPNILCLVIFAYLAVRIKKLAPKGYTFPEYIKSRLGTRSHIVYIIIFLAWQITAVAINCLAGGALINLLTGIPYPVAVVLMVGIALSYALFSGLKASVITDVIQMIGILAIVVFIVPWVVTAGGGFSAIASGLGGIGKFHLFDLHVAYSFGISATIGLISGAVGDQMFWQRAHALQKKYVKRSFVYGALIFGLIPLLLSSIGLLGANPAITSQLADPSNGQMIGIQVVQVLLPEWASLLFVFMLLAGLCSTLDSALCAGSSLGAIDIYKTYVNPGVAKADLLKTSRVVMIGLALLGTGIALVPGMKILYIFLIYGAMMASTLVPTILSLWWKRLSPNGVFWGVLFGFVIGLPLAVHGNFSGNIHLVVLSSIIPVVISTVICIIFSYTPLFLRQRY